MNLDLRGCSCCTDIPKGDWFCPECDAMMSRGISQELAIR